MPFTRALLCLPHPSADLPLRTCGTKNRFFLFQKRGPAVQQHNSLKPWVFWCCLSRGWRQHVPPGDGQLAVSSPVPSAGKRVLRCGSCLGGVTFAGVRRTCSQPPSRPVTQVALWPLASYFPSYEFDGTFRGCNVGDLRVLVCVCLFFLFCF